MTTQPQAKPPVPRPEEDDKPFWDVTKRHELVIQRCAECKQFRPHPS